MVRLLVMLLLVVPFAAAASNDDDGFVWVDANTKIKVKPIGKSAAEGASKAPEPKKAEKKEEPKK